MDGVHKVISQFKEKGISLPEGLLKLERRRNEVYC